MQIERLLDDDRLCKILFHGAARILAEAAA